MSHTIHFATSYRVIGAPSQLAPDLPDQGEMEHISFIIIYIDYIVIYIYIYSVYIRVI